MANVTPADVKKLRDTTGAGMLDCKNALVKADGDFKEAEKILKKQGLATADKRSGRATNQGAVFTKITKDKAAIAELTCETDFVAKNEKFRETGENIAGMIIDQNLAEINDALETRVKEAIAILKENMTLKRIKLVNIAENEIVVDYLHNGGKIGVLVKLTCDSAGTAAKEEVKTLAFDLALHVAAYSPSYLNRDSVDQAYLKEQEEIFTDQAKKLGKPENVLAGIVKGKINKHLSQICLLDQGFVKEEKTPVSKIVQQTAKEAGGTIDVTDFTYFMVGQE